MRTNLETELFIKSEKAWGIGSQLNMLAEEASELSVAALHLNRANKDPEKSFESFAEEIADVEFMIAEFKYLYPQLEEKVIAYRQAKARKLDNLLLHFQSSKEQGDKK